ncbi:MAG TPA: TetR/AcrR family transcriptional regulator [Aldersonia sp.]
MAETDLGERLVAAAVDLLVTDPTTLLDGGLRAQDAAAAARISQTSFYRKYHKSSFLDAVVAALARQPALDSSDLGAALTAALTAHQGDPRPVLRDAIGREFARDADERAATRRVLAAVFCASGGTRVVADLRRDARDRDARIAATFDALFASWGATLRAPFGVATLAVTLVAMLDGLALRRRVDPDAVPDWLVGEVALALLTTLVDTHELHEHVDDAAAQLAADIAASFQLARAAELPENPRRAVIDAARTEFGRRGYFLARLEAIAAASAVPLATVRRLFPTKAHIVVGGLKDGFLRLGEAVADDLALDRDEIDTVRRHLLRCATLARDEPEYTDALIAAVSHDTYADAESTLEIKQELPFPALIAPVIERGQQRGVFADQNPAGEVAATLTNTLFLRCFTRRGATPAEHVDAVAGLLLDGLRRRA